MERPARSMLSQANRQNNMAEGLPTVHVFNGRGIRITWRKRAQTLENIQTPHRKTLLRRTMWFREAMTCLTLLIAVCRESSHFSPITLEGIVLWSLQGWGMIAFSQECGHCGLGGIYFKIWLHWSEMIRPSKTCFTALSGIFAMLSP